METENSSQEPLFHFPICSLADNFYKKTQRKIQKFLNSPTCVDHVA